MLGFGYAHLIGYAAVGTVLLFSWGCATGYHAPAESPTEGVFLELLTREGTNTAVLYRVEPDGSISFGGGWNARREETTWTGRLSDHETDTLLRLLRDGGWFDDNRPQATGQADESVTTFTLAWPGGHRSDEFIGRIEALSPIRDVLDTAALRRLESDLDRLPKPSAPTDEPEY